MATAAEITSETNSDSATDPHMILVGGRSNRFPDQLWLNKNAIFMNKKHQHSPFLTRLPSGLQEDISVCAAPDGFIVSGLVKTNLWFNESVSLRVKRFSIKDQAWSDLPDMLHVSSGHGSVCVDNHFFTVGGRSPSWTSLSNVTMLDIGSLALRDCDSLETVVSRPSIAALDGEFLVLGGSGFKETQVCKYDAHTGKRTNCQPMPKPCYSHNRTATSGKLVFVLHDNGTLFMMYDVSTDQWSELPPPIKRVNWSAMVFFNGRLVVTGGSGPDGNTLQTYQTYDIENATWWLERKILPITLSEHTAIVADVPNSMKIPKSFDHFMFWVFSLRPLFLVPLVVFAVPLLMILLLMILVFSLLIIFIFLPFALIN